MSIQRLDELDCPASLEIESGQVLIAEVVVETHPVMSGRVLVAGTDERGRSFEEWLPCLEGLSIRAKDKVVIQRPANSQEALVTGVVESRHRQARQQSRVGGELTLGKDECMRINDYNGDALLDIVAGESGPSIQLHRSLGELDVPGSFRLVADSLDFKARRGEMTLAASGDIRVDGEMIKLN